MSEGDGKPETMLEAPKQDQDYPDSNENVTESSDQTIAIQNVDEAANKSQLVIDPEPYIKHPLQNRWALWFFKNDRTKDWLDNLKLVTTFDTVEDFWALFNHIQPSSKIQQGCDYNLFKDGIKPQWEDDANRKGGKWTVNLPKQQRNTELDKLWLETVGLQTETHPLRKTCADRLRRECLIGEGFGEDSDYVNGAVVQLRPKGDRVSIWTSDFKQSESILEIGKKYKERLTLPKQMPIGFQTHKDSMKKSSSTVKNMFTV